MALEVFFSIKHFLLKEIDFIDTGVFTITKHPVKKSEVLNKDFKSLIGMRALHSFENSAIAYSTIFASDEATQKKEFVQKLHTMETFLLFLWFVKDNSISIDELYGHFLEKNTLTWRDNHMDCSNSDGSFRNVEFTEEELRTATNLLTKFAEICPNVSLGPHIGESYQDNETAVKSRIDIYKIQNCIERGIAFLHTARGISHVPQKITHYMSILECLFSLDSNEVVQKVCERTAYYIGKNKEERIQIFKTVKDSYDIRSKFVHGQKTTKSADVICRLSTEVDEIIRKVLIKVISKDHEIFLKDDKDRRGYLNQLIF
jgi:hypothetical protein